MNIEKINTNDFLIKANDIWDNQWLLLTSGDFEKKHFNPMTIGWGSFGIMWGLPFVQVLVRPTRYTYEFMNQYDTFTVCAFSKQYRKVLSILGTKSGRDMNKIDESGLTPIASQQVRAPGFEEAELIVECRKIYWYDITPDHFLDPSIDKHYPQKDYHRVHFGQILNLRGTEKFSSQ